MAGASSLALALDIGATRLRAALVDAGGRVVERRDDRTLAEDGPAAVLERSVALLREVTSGGASSGRAAPTGIGVSAPGPLDPVAARWIEPPNMGPAFRGAEIAAPLRDAFGLPVAVDRDTNVAALAEQAFGAARGASDFLYITLSTGLGGAIVSRGELLWGPDGVAGELGHQPAALDGPPCGCGAVGHLEGLASGSGIARAGTAAALDGRSRLLEERHAGGALEATDVADAEAAGDPVAAEIMERARAAFAAALVGLVNVFNPELIVVGGGIAEAQPEQWLDRAQEAIGRQAFTVPARRARVVPAALGPDVGLVGAVPLLRVRAPKLD